MAIPPMQLSVGSYMALWVMWKTSRSNIKYRYTSMSLRDVDELFPFHNRFGHRKGALVNYKNEYAFWVDFTTTK